MMRKRETFYDYNYTRIVFIIVYCTVSYNSSHCTLLYIYVCKHIYTHTQSSHICNIDMSRVHYARSRECRCKSPRASLTIVRTRADPLESDSLARIHHRVVCTRAFMCVRWCDRDLTSPSREARRKVMKRDSLRRLEIERCSRSRQSRMRFFARARGLSRSQPVFVIIMLEKCMNICFINASSYFISFYDKKKNWNRTSRDSLIPCNNLYLYIYILYIYLCIIRYCAHYCSQS